MIRWTPGAELANLHGAMDRLYEDFFGPVSGSNGDSRQRIATYSLPLDVLEVDDGYEIHAPVPGFKPDDVQVTFSDGVLRIRAERSLQPSQQPATYLRKEVAYGNYVRNIQLPGEISEDNITASFEDGVLTIVVPKAPRPQAKKIPIAGRSERKEKRELAGQNS